MVHVSIATSYWHAPVRSAKPGKLIICVLVMSLVTELAQLSWMLQWGFQDLGEPSHIASYHSMREDHIGGTLLQHSIQSAAHRAIEPS